VAITSTAPSTTMSKSTLWTGIFSVVGRL